MPRPMSYFRYVVVVLLHSSCDVLMLRHLPRLPRRHPTIEEAQRHYQRMNTPEMRNQPPVLAGLAHANGLVAHTAGAYF